MRRRLMLLAVVLGVAALFLAGMIRDPLVTRATVPPPPPTLPIQPWAADTDLRVSTTALGATVINESVTTVPFGSRINGSFWYSEGVVTPPDSEMTDGLPHGGLLALYDIQCDSAPGGLDVLADSTSVAPNFIREPWNEQTTGVVGQPTSWVLSAGPPYAIAWRLVGNFDTVWFGGTLKTPLTQIMVNLSAYTMPWSTRLALTFVSVGEGTALTSTTCSDSTANSNSHITDVFANPPPEGDSGAACPATGCADKQIHGFWTKSRVSLTASGSTDIAVTKRVLNNGPAVGSFTDIWEVEVPPTGLTATFAGAVDQSHYSGTAWVDDPDPTPVAGGGTALISFPETALPTSTPIQYVGSLHLACATAGDYLVTLKDFTFPLAGTVDNDLRNNVALYSVRVICGTAAANSTDLQVIVLKDTLTVLNPATPNYNLAPLPQTGEHVQLIAGQTATVAVKATEFNVSTAIVPALQTFVAEAPDDITAEFVPITGDVPVPGGVRYAWNAPKGDSSAGGGQYQQSRNLSITCPISVVPGVYPVAVKVINAPVGVGETKPADNARSSVIEVWCWPVSGPTGLDGVDDGSGLVTRWTLLTPRFDIEEIRKGFDKTNPTALRSDTRYGDRTVDLQCNWVDANGAPNQNGDVYTGYPGTPPVIEPWESQLDPNKPYGMDDDSDCLADAKFSQPGHAVDEKDGGKDTDGDGVSDAVETVLGSDPNNAAKTPEATLGAVAHGTCTDTIDNDLDGHIEQCDEAACPDANGVAPWDTCDNDVDGKINDGCRIVSDTAETVAQCANNLDDDGDGYINDGCAAAGTPAVAEDMDSSCDPNDADGDGWANWFETAAGSDPNDAAKTPENIAAPMSCVDNVDNDGDGNKDGADSGCADGDAPLCTTGLGATYKFTVAQDEDCDGLLDGVEKAFGSNPKLADSDDDGATDATELFQFSNPVDPDTDGDGLLDKPDDDYLAAPYGGPVNSIPETSILGNCTDLKDNDADGRIDAADPGCATLDSDTDTVPDVVERALGSNPDTQCMDQLDNDIDGKVNDGCPQVGAISESSLTAKCNDKFDDDGDGYINDGCPAAGTPATPESSTTGLGTTSKPESWITGTCNDGLDNDGDGVIDSAVPNAKCPNPNTDTDGDTYGDNDEMALHSVWINEAGETANSDDNCPTVYNPDQANNDGWPRPNGPTLDGAFSSNPTGDTLGDACDIDDDNDRALDAAETVTMGTDPFKMDSDGDRCPDGVEVMLGSVPTDGVVKCPVIASEKQTLFRTCHINLPDQTKWPNYSPGYSGEASVENDPDGDGALCPNAPSGAPSGDYDADDNLSAAANICVGSHPCTEIVDALEIEGYNTAPAISDTDGDGCEDWIEIVDVNGDRKATGLDKTQVSLRNIDSKFADPVSDAVLDVNKDGKITGLDATLVGLNSSVIKSLGNTMCTAAGKPSTDQQRELP